MLSVADLLQVVIGGRSSRNDYRSLDCCQNSKVTVLQLKNKAYF